MSGFQSKNLYFRFADEDKRDSCSHHVCKYCGREFLSGRALGGHMRAHGSVAGDSDAATAVNTTHHEKLEQFSSTSIGDGDVQLRSLGYDPDVNTDLHTVSNSTYRGLSCRIKLENGTFKQLSISKRNPIINPSSKSGEDPELEEDDHDVDEEAEEDEYEDDTSMKASATSALYGNALDCGDGAVARHGDDVHDTDFDNLKSFSLHDKAALHGPLYTLRRNPKPSKRFIDREYAVEMEAHEASAAPQIPSTKISCLDELTRKAHACTECGKEFSSWKALFGHMRCHPEREWRGIQRPIFQDQEKPLLVSLPENSSVCKKKIALSPSEDVEHESEKLNYKQATSDHNNDPESIEAAAYMHGDQISIQGWMRGKRSKRSRQVVRSLQAVTDNAPELGSYNTSNDIKEDTDMANCLVMLASASRNQELSPMPKMRRKLSIASTDFDRRSVSSDINIHKKRQIRIIDDNYYDADVRDRRRQSYDKTCEESLGERQSYGKDQSRMKLIRPVNIADDSSLCEGMNEEGIVGSDHKERKAKYECATCKRIFKSHQALGGHRASHKKVKGCFARTHASDGGESPGSPEEEITDEDLTAYSDEERFSSKYGQQNRNENEKETTSYAGIRKSGLSKKKGHECSICHRVFPSGQALGGHKRCHWGGAGLSETSIVPTSSTSHSHIIKQAAAVGHGLKTRIGREDLQLDLNMPAPEDDYENFYMDCQASVAIPQKNQLATTSITDENMMMTETKACGEFNFPHMYDAAHQKLTGSSNMSNDCRLAVPYHDGLKHIVVAADQETSLISKERVAVQDSELPKGKAGSIRADVIDSSTLYMHCNICEQVLTSDVEAIASHQKTHALSVMSSSVAGLTPAISA